MTWALANFPRPPLLLVPWTCWTMAVDRVGFKKLYFEDLNLRGHSAIFSLV